MARWYSGLVTSCLRPFRWKTKSASAPLSNSTFSTEIDFDAEVASDSSDIEPFRFWNQFRSVENQRKKKRRFSFRKNRKSEADRRLAADIDQERNELQRYRFKDTDLMKHHRYRCPVDRPRICICTCEHRKAPFHTTTTSEGSEKGSPWSWVFQNNCEDEEAMAERLNKRLNDMLGI